MSEIVSLKEHWENVYKNSEPKKLGWYEDVAEPSLKLIAECHLPKSSRILHIGAGTTKLIDDLIEQGYNNQIVNDLSKYALKQLQSRLNKKGKDLEFIAEDILDPIKLNSIENVDLWHDRAVLHFFWNESERHAYFDLMNRVLSVNGFAIIASFHFNSAEYCSGLPVNRVDQQILSDEIGSNYQLLDAFQYNYTMPSGQLREYVYTLFQRIS